MKEILKEYIDKKIEVDGLEGTLREISNSYFVVDMTVETYNDDDSFGLCTWPEHDKAAFGPVVLQRDLCIDDRNHIYPAAGTWRV